MFAALPGDATDQDECEQNDADLFEANPAKEEPADKNRQVGKRGAEVGLLEHKQHGNEDKGRDLADFSPAQFLSGEAPEVAGHCNDKD